MSGVSAYRCSVLAHRYASPVTTSGPENRRSSEPAVRALHQEWLEPARLPYFSTGIGYRVEGWCPALRFHRGERPPYDRGVQALRQVITRK